MAQIFTINKNSTLPSLRLRLNNDGRHNFKKMFNALQNSDVYFTMENQDTGIKKISKAKAFIVKLNEDNCQDEYGIEYRWNKRDTNEDGTFVGKFTVKLNEDITQYGIYFPSGDLIVPISEELIININKNSIKK